MKRRALTTGLLIATLSATGLAQADPGGEHHGKGHWKHHDHGGHDRCITIATIGTAMITVTGIKAGTSTHATIVTTATGFATGMHIGCTDHRMAIAGSTSMVTTYWPLSRPA